MYNGIFVESDNFEVVDSLERLVDSFTYCLPINKNGVLYHIGSNHLTFRCDMVHDEEEMKRIDCLIRMLRQFCIVYKVHYTTSNFD